MARIERRQGFWVAVHGERRSGPFATSKDATEGLRSLLAQDEVLLSGHRFELGNFWGFEFEVRRRAVKARG